MFQNYYRCNLTHPLNLQLAFGWLSHSFLHVWRETRRWNFTWPRGPVILQCFASRVWVFCNNTPGAPCCHHTHSARLWFPQFAWHWLRPIGWSIWTFLCWPIIRQRILTFLKEAALAHIAKANNIATVKRRFIVVLYCSVWILYIESVVCRCWTGCESSVAPVCGELWLHCWIIIHFLHII